MHILEQLNKTFINTIINSEFWAIEWWASSWKTDLKEKENSQHYKDADWYNELSEVQQNTIDEKIEEKQKIEKSIEWKKSELSFKWLKADILNKWIERNNSLIEDQEDQMEIKSFEERVDMINRDMDLLSRELYSLNLKSNSENLSKASNEANSYFKENFLKNWETNEFILDLIENKDLLNITAWEIYSLKQEWYDLSKLFLIWWKENVDKDTMKVWDSFIVNFGWNKSLNNLIWAWDLLPIDQIDKVIINWVEWERKLNPRPWYYSTDWKYLAIFDNYKVEIVSKKEYTIEEKEKSLLAFKNRFEEVRKPEVISNLREQLSNNWDINEISLEGFSKNDLEIITWYLTSRVSNENLANLNFDLDKWILSTKSGESINEIINRFIPNESLWKWYEKYKDIVINISNKYWIKTESLIILINHENPAWNPLASAPWSSAYWLWQMINSTWTIYWEWLNRNNPSDQLEATCRYLNAIKNRKNCPDELAMAYYNTWEWIMNISDSKAQEYARKNPAINRKIPADEYIDAKTYFKWAIAYYNNKIFDEVTI